MTAPRQVVPGRAYMLTRRCSERRCFLRPSDETNQAYVYCFAVAAKRYGIDTYWLSTMSTHEHPGIGDVLGNYPEFSRYFRSLLARCLNARLGRWDSFWSNDQPGVTHLPDPDTVFNKMIYGLTNPAKDHLVDRVFDWPGVSSLRYQLAGKPMVVNRPAWFFDRGGDLPERIELHFKRPPGFEQLTQEEWADKIRAAVAKVERAAAEERARSGRKALGRKAVLRQTPYASPASSGRHRTLRPTVATKDRQLRIALLLEKKRFQVRYRAAFERRRAGDGDVVFPYGSYRLCVLGLVRCEPPPAHT